MRARPSALARTTAHPRATEFTQRDELRGRAAGGLADAVTREGAGTAFRVVVRGGVVTTRVVVRLGGAFAATFAEAFGFARDVADVTVGAVGFSVRGGAATRVVLPRVIRSVDAVERGTGVGAVAAGVGAATTGVGAATGAGVSVVGVAVDVDGDDDTAGGGRRITEGGGSQGSRSRALSTGGGAESTGEVSAVIDSPDATTCALSAIAPADSTVNVSIVARLRENESTATTVVESGRCVVSTMRVAGPERLCRDVPALSATLAAGVESAVDARSTVFFGASSPRTSQAPRPMLMKAPIPTPFQSFGPTGGFAGVVPHQRQAPWWAG